MSIQEVAVYPDEGFAVMKDDEGAFLMFKDTDEIVPLTEVEHGKIWKLEKNPATPEMAW
jgi:hypothetical protein